MIDVIAWMMLAAEWHCLVPRHRGTAHAQHWCLGVNGTLTGYCGSTGHAVPPEQVSGTRQSQIMLARLGLDVLQHLVTKAS
jgi:hypothetical protein